MIDLAGHCSEIVLNWNSSRLAVCQESNLITIFRKSKKDESWKDGQKITIDSSPKRLKWAHSDFGNAFVIKTSDNRVLVFKEKNVTQFDDSHDMKKVMKWEQIFEKNIHEEDTVLQDIKFAPPHFGRPQAKLGFAISMIYQNGFLEVLSLQEPSTHTANVNANSLIRAKQKISDKTLKALSWKKDEEFGDAVVVSYCDQSTEASGRDRISIWGYKDKFFLLDPLLKVNSLLDSDVEDVNWSISCGRSYQMICCCGKDGILVWRMRFEHAASQLSTTVLDVFKDGGSQFSYPIRCKFNYMASLITTSSNDLKIKVWTKAPDYKWIEDRVISCK